MLHRGGFRIPLENRRADPREKRQGAQQYILQTFSENLMNSEKNWFESTNDWCGGFTRHSRLQILQL